MNVVIIYLFLQDSLYCILKYPLHNKQQALNNEDYYLHIFCMNNNTVHLVIRIVFKSKHLGKPFTGLSDVPGEAMVKSYCPKCMDVYTPKSSRHHHSDGAYFGTGFPHMLFMVHPEYRPKRPANQFVPR